MKMKNIFVTLAGLALLGGASVGLANGQKTMKAEAAGGTETTPIMYVAINTSTVNSASYSDFNLRINCNIGDGGTWRQTVMTKTSDTTTFSGKTVFSGNYTEKYGGVDAMQIQIYDGDTWKSQVVVYDSWTTTGSFGGNLYKYEEKTWVADYVSPIPSYTITKMAVEFVGGVAQEPADWSLGSDEILEGNSHAVPGTVYKNLEHFGGWYKNASCTVAYTGTASVTANATIYAKFTRLSVDSYIYWISESSTPIFDHFYAYNEYETVGWPGESITSYEVSGVVTFNGLSQKIYKIPVPSNADFIFILNNNNDKQTVNISTITLRAGYYTYKDGSTYSANINVEAGEALDFIFQLEEKRNAVAAAGDIKAYSVCGISKSDAQTLVSAYAGLSATAKGYVDNSSTYTYKRDDSSQQDNISLSDIMVQITAIANKPDGSHNMDITNTNNALMIVVVSAISLVALSSFVLLRKKRNSK